MRPDSNPGAFFQPEWPALDRVNLAVACAFMLSLQALATGQECGSTPGPTLLAGAPGAGEHISHLRDPRERPSWAAAMRPRVCTASRLACDTRLSFPERSGTLQTLYTWSGASVELVWVACVGPERWVRRVRGITVVRHDI